MLVLFRSTQHVWLLEHATHCVEKFGLVFLKSCAPWLRRGCWQDGQDKTYYFRP